VPRINGGEDDRERYRLFNAGRARAFAERCGAGAAEVRFSASSAVGAPGEELRTAFLAAASPALHLENPRQTRAYRYPRAYGPAPPSFSRATVASVELGGAFFLSGTASIVGHETRHAGSIARQLEETLANIGTMIEEARAASGRSIPPLARFDLVKVYLRHAAHLAPVRAALAGALEPGTPALFLEADICRSDLLVEIEGVAALATDPHDALRHSA
jgi:chorismate lyase/3-hydroxybenzoate synthase